MHQDRDLTSKPPSDTLLEVKTTGVAGGKENQHCRHADKPDDATDIKQPVVCVENHRTIQKRYVPRRQQHAQFGRPKVPE